MQITTPWEKSKDWLNIATFIKNHNSRDALKNIAFLHNVNKNNNYCILGLVHVVRVDFGFYINLVMWHCFFWAHDMQASRHDIKASMTPRSFLYTHTNIYVCVEIKIQYQNKIYSYMKIKQKVYTCMCK